MRRTCLAIVLTLVALSTRCSRLPTAPSRVDAPQQRQVENVPRIYEPLYGGGIGLDEIEPFRASLPYDSISLERTGCYGTCPVYTMTLYRSGKAELNAEKYIPSTAQVRRGS